MFLFTYLFIIYEILSKNIHKIMLRIFLIYNFLLNYKLKMRYLNKKYI